MNSLDSWDSLDSWSSYNSSPATLDEDCLYEHLRNCVKTEPTDHVIARFRQLFIDAQGYTDSQVWQALSQVVQDPEADKSFKYTLNRCCYTLINPWQTRLECHAAIPKLVALFEQLPTHSTQSKFTIRLRTLVRQFRQTEQYAALNRLPHVLLETNDQEAGGRSDNRLEPLIKRYPYIYDHSLLTEDSDKQHKRTIKGLRRKAERKFGVDLVRYNSRRLGHFKSKFAENPTLLSNAELDFALEYYTGKIERNRTHRDVARCFSAYSQTVRSYREFKGEFTDYLLTPIAAVAPIPISKQFSRQLQQYLQDTLSDFDSESLNNFVLVETCRRLLNFLIVDSPQHPNFQTFISLIRDIGYSLTVGLLLRIVLLCSSSKPWLERCFSILFNLHEKRYREDVPWLVTSLEHVNVALATNFGGYVISCR